MTSIAELEEAVARLAPRELAAFRDWFERFEAERFDRDIEEDVRSGRLDCLADEALGDLRRGDIREL